MPESRRPTRLTQANPQNTASSSGGGTSSGRMNAGPYEAIVISHLDPQYMGGLKVELLKKTKSGATPERSGQIIEVKYLSPFYGVTAFSNAGSNDGYEYTQKSYGFWAVPPDPNTRVLVIFAEGDISQGYWIGCIQDKYMNFMVPDGRASTEIVTSTPNSIRGIKLPVGEYNKKINPGAGRDPTQYRKPYNKDFTQVLEIQGLLRDEHRGTTTTSARREVPSMVFGWSTPGPIDRRPGAPKGLYGEHGQKANVFVNRLGGSSFVMDDGDDKYVRETPAGEGPPRYINLEAGSSGDDKTIPLNELVRLRTRTGHQILLHNSEDLIYIGNARGTGWIEMTSNGKIDMYGLDSISIHSDMDINLTADRDVNIEAGRNINARASARWSEYQLTDERGFLSGCVNIESKYDTDILVEKDYKLTVLNNADEHIIGERKVTVNADSHHKTGGSHYLTASTSSHTVAGSGLYEQSGTNISMQASGIIAADASEIYLDSGLSSAATQAIAASDVIPLIRHNVPKVEPGLTTAFTVESIVKRMPTHEPYPQHENLNPVAYNYLRTDREEASQLPETEVAPLADTFRKSGFSTGSGSRVNPGSGALGGGTSGLTTPGSSVTGSDPLAPGSTGVSRATADEFTGTIGEPFEGEVPQPINGFSLAQTRSWAGALGFRESTNRYHLINDYGFAGKYQFGAAALETLGYMTSGSADIGNSSLNTASRWTGKNGATSMQAWLANEGNCQEIAVVENANFNLRVLRRLGSVDDNDELEHIGGMLFGAHLLGAGGISAWARGEGGADAYGTTGDEYYNLGVEAIRRAG